MKKIFCIAAAVFIVLTAVDFSAFAETLALSKTNVDLPVDYFTTVSVSGAGGNIKWFSGDKNVAEVEARDGNSADIIGIDEGETYIYAKTGGKTLKFRVTVKQAFISASSDSAELYTGESKTIQLAVSGSHEIALKNSDKNVCSASWGKWDNGLISLTINAKSEGTAQITVYIKGHASHTAKAINIKVNGTEIIALEDNNNEDEKVSLIKDVFPISQRITESYDELYKDMQKIIDGYPFECAVSVYSLDKGYLFQHDSNKYLPGASTIKLIYAYYCCTQIEQGNHSLDEKVTYQSKHKVGGAGSIQNTEYGSVWTIEQLIYKALNESDNVAYYMLIDTFGKTGFNKMVRDWGYETQLGSYNYPNVSPELLNTAMLKVHNKAVSSKNDCWKIAWEALLKSTQSEIRMEIDYCATAVKYGRTYEYYNEVCYVDSESPYIIVIMSKTNNDDERKYGDEKFFRSVAECADKINAVSQASEIDIYDKNCAATIEHFAISNKNPYISSPIEYKIDNKNNNVYVNLTFDNYADVYTLSNCIVDVSVNGGSFYFGGSSSVSSGRVDLSKPAEIIVTDNNGLKKKYTIKTERTVYDLPIVNIYLENTASIDSIDRNNYTAMTFSVDTTGDKSFKPTELTSGKIRGRGNSTWKWDKKPYRIKLDKAASVLGLEEDKDWILLANYSDKSLIRNTVAYDMGRCLDGMDWSPVQYPVDLFINGVYRGVYTIGEQMEIADGRVEIDKKSKENDTGFLLEVGGVDDPNMKNGIDYFLLPSDKNKMVAFKDPDGEKLTNGQRKFIIDYVSKADAAIVSGKNYEDYIDVDSFCDWIIIHELTYNMDSCFRRSCYITKDKGGKLKMGPIWDFDIAFGNCNKDNQNYNDWVTVGKNDKNAYVTENWCTHLMADKSFRSRLRSRWFEVKDKLLSTAMKSIDTNSKKIFRSQQENFKVWKIWGKKAGYQSWRNFKYESYELQIKYLKDFISSRAEWIDKNI